MRSRSPLAAILWGLLLSPALAQMRPPAFFAGVPGLVQMQSIVLQRHQARTLLYREALEELKKNPAAADVRECPAAGPQPGELCIRAPEKTTPPPSPQALAGRKLAVLFGNNAYPKPIPALETPIFDVQEIGQVLKDRFGYEIRLVRDAKKADVVNTLNQIGAETKPDDSVLVFYAGHGYLMDDTKMGYWIPVDGSTKSPANWVSNSDISLFLKNIPAQQLLLISDSCFSGSLAREQSLTSRSASVDRKQILHTRSVLTMSSGGEEPVSDEGKEGHSIFAWALINALKNSGPLTSGVQIFQGVKIEVVKDYPQTPQYGAVFSAGHIAGGEYLFEKP
jgi:hypothetical protein